MTPGLHRAILPAALLAFGLTARAHEIPPQPFARVSIASTDRIKQILTDLGAPTPLDPAQFLRAKHTFLGEDWFDTTKPVGILFLVGEDFREPWQLFLFAYPANPGKGTVEQLATLGGSAVAGQPDTANMDGKAAFRRTPHYLLMYRGDAGVLKRMPSAPFENDYKNKDAIARVTLDMKTFRDAYPGAYHYFLVTALGLSEEMNHLAKSPAKNPYEGIICGIAASALEKLDQFNLSLDMNDDSLHLASTIAPSPIKGTRPFPKPRFGPHPLMTADFVYPTTDAAGWLAFVDKMAFETFRASHPSTKLAAEKFAWQQQALQTILSAAVGDAQSIALENSDGHLVLTIVNQYTRDVDLPEVLREKFPIIAGEYLDRTEKSWTLADAPRAAGFSGVTLKDGDNPLVVTVLQKRNIAVITISDQPIPAAPRFTLSPTEKISEILSLTVDLAAAIKVAGEPKIGLLASLPEDARKALLEKFAGKTLTLTLTLANDAAGAMTVNAEFPVDFIKVCIAAATHRPMPH